MINKFIKISSLLYLLNSTLIILYTPIGYIFFTIGLILLAYSFLAESELKKKKGIIIIIAIISCFLNLISAVLLFIAISDLESESPVKNNSPPAISTESKRIDLLLKLGLGMIIISGVLFATTSWEIITNLVKVIALVFMGVLFLSLSMFTEKKLNLKRTAKAYFILGLLFILLTWIGIGHFGIISKWFSYAGDGKYLVYFITSILLIASLYVFSKKYQQKEYKYIALSLTYISAYQLLSALSLSISTTIFILTSISLIINIIPNNKKTFEIKSINYVVSYLYPVLVFTQCFDKTGIIILLPCLVNILNLLILAIKEKNVIENILIIIMTYSLIIISVLASTISFDKAFILFSVLAIFSLLIKHNKFNKSKALIIANQIIFNIIATTLIVILSFNHQMLLLIATLIYLTVNIINCINVSKITEEIDFRYQPIVIFMVINAAISFISIKLTSIEHLTSFAITTIIYALIRHFSKEKAVNKYYNVFFIIATILLYIQNLTLLEIFPAITICVLTTYLFYINKNKTSIIKIITYIFILLGIINLINSIHLSEIGSTINSLLTLLIFIALTLIVKDNQLKIVNYIAISIPLYSFVNSFNINYNLNLVLNNLFYIYLLFLLLKLIIKNKNVRDIVGTIGISLIVLEIITIADIYIGLYIGILGILIIFITFNEEEYKKIFYCGIIITILNIIIQLWELWSKIPFWLYLLLVGLLIIAFVTYKELHKTEEPKKVATEQKKPEQELLSIPIKESTQEKESPKNTPEEIKIEKARFCPRCGTENKNGNFCRKCGTNLIIK